MSTFNGLVEEFPDIKIDFFRHNILKRPPLACFLSHVHSDHLAGLESLRSPFVYCSAATREMLLRLERYPCRLNYAKGILEARQQTYKHLKKVLKPLPLGTPTMLELEPGNRIQVTLFDANHCPGSVMFLIEGNGKAILYTGDIRCELWFIHSIARHPALIPYTSGLKVLDKLYLDTSFTGDIPFQSKSEGIADLLRQVAQYPKETIFHLHAWTFGYEDVWMALSKALDSRVHVDEYKMGIYKSLSKWSQGLGTADSLLVPEAAWLNGFTCGNSRHPGCLTSDINVQIHACEKGNTCAIASNPDVVTILPVVAHLPEGEYIAEMGVGGGGNDLERHAEVGYLTKEDLAEFISQILPDNDPKQLQDDILKENLLAVAQGYLNLDIALSALNDDLSANFTTLLSTLKRNLGSDQERKAADTHSKLPRVIRFPYARHSSYLELCKLVGLFKPKDVWPCTEDCKAWARDGISIESLFGEYCSGKQFTYDLQIKAILDEPNRFRESETQDSYTQDSQTTQFSDTSDSGSLIRRDAYYRMLENASGANWTAITLISTNDNHVMHDVEL